MTTRLVLRTSPRGRRLVGPALLLLAHLYPALLAEALGPQDAWAQILHVSGKTAELEMGGYVRTLTGIYDLGYDLPDGERTSGFNGEVVRLKWNLRFGQTAVVEVHNRIQAQIASTGSGFGESVAGFGVSVVPGRSLDLSTNLVDQDRLQAWHDVDRLSLTVYTGLGDITLGRQAITWGISSLFPVADLWAQFSPFELDTEEKPGIDALRILTYPGDGWEVDAVVADRGSAGDFSAGIRASLSASWADLHLAGGKFWNEALALAGISAPVGGWKVRAEVVLPYDLDQDDWDTPRGTLGLDWLGGAVMMSGEYHFNGIGATDPAEYGVTSQDPRFARGESYYLGRHYLGGVAAWSPGNDRLNLSLSSLINLLDPSCALTPVLTYDFGQNTRLSAGALVSFGDPPLLGETPTFRSEYGTYGDLVFTRLSIYF
jgi:hypothetical protein